MTYSRRTDDRLGAHVPANRPASRMRYLPLFFAVTLTVSPSSRAGTPAAIDAPGVPTHAVGTSSGSAGLKTVTITAAQARRRLRRSLSRFVFSVVVNYMRESLPRWDKPICPLVAGLPRNQGDYILARITNVAAAAHAPLAGRNCKPDLFVIATSSPDLFLKKWWDRDPQMYSDCNGLGGVETFLHSKEPVRAWYNVALAGPNGGRAMPIDLDAPAIGVNLSRNSGGCIGGGLAGTRLFLAPQALTQVFVVVDMRQTKGLSIGQLADYVSMVGLAQIRPDNRPTGPTILTVFEKQKHTPEGLSAWDRALLYALYHTPQTNPLQVSLMENSMVSRILPPR